MSKGYCYQEYDPAIMARAIGKNMNCSTKHAVEICRMIKNMNLQRAKKELSEVIEFKRAVPFKRYNKNVAHKKTMMSGRYPVKAAKFILALLKSVEKNAQSKGMGTADLEIIHINANKASTPLRYGRKIGVETKRTHVEVVVKEVPKEKTAKQKNNQKEKLTNDVQKKKNK